MVYIDDARIPYGRMIMCHMIADSRDELIAMARKIGVSTRWLQDNGSYKEHIDVCWSKRSEAVKNGATEVGVKDLARILLSRRK